MSAKNETLPMTIEQADELFEVAKKAYRLDPSGQNAAKLASAMREQKRAARAMKSERGARIAELQKSVASLRRRTKETDYQDTEAMKQLLIAQEKLIAEASITPATDS